MKLAPCWKITIAILLASMPGPAFADDKSEAQALFDRGVADLQAGKTDEACKELAASLAKVSDSGTKGVLAICTTKQGKIATAWQLWRDLAVTAPTDEMKSDAAKNATELEPRLPKYTVKAPAIAGLVVTVNGSTVDLGIGVPLPVDPGKVAITAKAPGYNDYSGEATATEGQTTTIEVPALVATPKPPPPPIDPGGTATLPHDTSKFGLITAGVGGVSLLGGVVFGLRARGKWNDAKDLCGDIDNCPGDKFGAAKKNYDAASTSATISTVLVGVGVLAIAGGTIWYLKERPREPRMALRPVVTPNQAGVTLVGSWR